MAGHAFQRGCVVIELVPDQAKIRYFMVKILCSAQGWVKVLATVISMAVKTLGFLCRKLGMETSVFELSLNLGMALQA